MSAGAPDPMSRDESPKGESSGQSHNNHNSIGSKHGLLDADPQSSNGFVFVTTPLPSVSQFTEWVDQQALPDAQTLMKGRRLKEDEVELMLDRASFIRDLVATFCKTSTRLAPSSEKKEMEVAEEQKRRSEGTLPTAGEGASNAHATTDGSGSPVKPKEFKVEPLPQDATEVQSIASLENPGTWEKVWKQFVIDLPRQQLRVEGHEGPIGVDEAYQVIMEFLQSLPDHAQEKISKFGAPVASKPSWVSTLFSPFTLVAGSVTGHNQDSKVDTETKALEGLQRLERFICLLCQQSVLAVPFEIIATQYMRSSSPDNQLFVGEIKNSGQAGTMKITLSKTPETRSGGGMPQIKIEKMFRVFALVEEEGDLTLFHVASELLVDLLAPHDEPLLMKWRILDASGKEKKKPADADLAAAGGAELRTTPPRTCECLGASSGYHKEPCPKYVGSNK